MVLWIDKLGAARAALVLEAYGPDNDRKLGLRVFDMLDNYIVAAAQEGEGPGHWKRK